MEIDSFIRIVEEGIKFYELLWKFLLDFGTKNKSNGDEDENPIRFIES